MRMENKTDVFDFIYKLWSDKKMSFAEIAETPIPKTVSMKRIQNIVYSAAKGLDSEREKELYAIYRIKFLECQDVSEAIRRTFDNQPPSFFSERQIRRIIAQELINRQEKRKKHEKNRKEYI